MDIYEKIEAFVSGEMTSQEQSAFEQQLQTDPILKQQWQVYNQLHEHLTNKQSVEAGEILLKNTIQEAIDEHKAATAITAKAIPMRKKLLLSLSSAAAVVLLVLVVRIAFFAPPVNGSTLYAQYSGFEKLSVTNRGNEEDSLLKIAVEYFNNADYKHAVPALDMYLRKNPAQSRYQLAKGYALVQIGDYVVGEQDLLQVENGSSSYVSDAKWYRALSRLKQDKTEEAKDILKKIESGEEHYIKAQEILKKL